MSDAVRDDDELLATAFALADAAAAVTLRHFRSPDLASVNKAAEGFDPVTVADRGAEEAMRAVLERDRPDDAIFGEEVGRKEGTSGLTWILDPIDGTRAFLSGLPTWGTLIALDDGTRGRIGIIDQPFLGERYLGVLPAAGPRAELHVPNGPRLIRTRATDSLGDATLFTTDPDLFTSDESEAFNAVRERVRLTRYGCDCYAYALLASGHVDLVIEAGLAAYDIAAHVPLITAAGGVVTGWQGEDCRWGGRVLAAANPSIHAAALEILSTAP